MKITISVGQALLILIDKYKDILDEKKLDNLKKLYLIGADTPENKRLIETWLKDKDLSGYNISHDFKVINDDPTRRYFETHLAFETLQTTLKDIDIGDLKEHYNSLYEMSCKSIQDKAIENNINDVLNGCYKKSSLLFIEYSDAIQQIKTGKQYQSFSIEDKEKLELLIKSAFLGIACAIKASLPIDIYGEGIYKSENRGISYKVSQSTTKSRQLGLMKGHMPVPRDDVSDADKTFSYLRAIDKADFNPESQWAKHNFGHLVHPFSNSISGTILAQIRFIKYLDNLGQLKFNGENSLISFIKAFSSVFLYQTGGHSFHELLFPLQLPEVQDAFKSFKNFNNMNEATLLLKENKVAFDKALADTIEYNKLMIKRSIVQESIKLVGYMEELKVECESYKNHLNKLVQKELKNYPAVYNKYANLKFRNDSQFTSKIEFDIDVLVDTIDSIKFNKDLPASTILLIDQYKTVKEIYGVLVKPGKHDVHAKCEEIARKFSIQKDVFEESNDNKLITFLKALLRVLTAGHLGREKGKEFSKKLTSLSFFNEKKDQNLPKYPDETPLSKKNLNP